jgi:hypothetical protein
MLKCPKNDKHDLFVRTVSVTKKRYVDEDDKPYSFPSHTVKEGATFCVICGRVAVEVEEDAETDTSDSTKR